MTALRFTTAGQQEAPRSSVSAMLDATSVAIVGASARADSFGARMVSEVGRTGDRHVDLINPRYAEVGGRRCLPSLRDLHSSPDLVLLGVGDHAVLDQLRAAAEIGARSAVIFGGLHTPGLRAAVQDLAAGAGMAVCGGGCMGFVNVATGLRAIGYVEREQLAPGPISLITHSGSVFSAMLRTRRALGYRLAVSSGQELVTTTADYLQFALDDPKTRLVGLVLETVRDGARLRATLRRAAEQDVAVVLLAVGGSPQGAAMVAAHSGAVAGDDATWEALCADTAVRRVTDLAELADTLELLALARRRGAGPRASGLATVHDSGAERTLLVDLAADAGVRFAAIAPTTRHRLAAALDEGLEPVNPLDLWGTGADTRALFASCLQTLAEDPDVGAVALGVDLVAEYDGDTSYPDAVLDVVASSPVPVAVLTNLASAVDEPTAARLRAGGVAVLEGTRSGLVALRHLLEPPLLPEAVDSARDDARRSRWRERLEQPHDLDTVEAFALLRDYGLDVVAAHGAESRADAVAAAQEIGYPVVLKTDVGVAHKSDAGGVRLGLLDDAAVADAYDQLSATFGKRVVVCAHARPGVELSIGFVRDAALGPMVVLAAGGVLVELLADRVVALPPLDTERAGQLLGGLRVERLLAGVRGAPPAHRPAVVRAVVGVAQLAVELGDLLDAVDVNPVIASSDAAPAVDALIIRRG